MASIQSAVGKTATSFQELADDVEHVADSAVGPVRRRQSLGMGYLFPPLSRGGSGWCGCIVHAICACGQVVQCF